MSEEILERRYRRLLACYPPAYRAAYGEEMLAVAMAAAEPGRRWPDPGEAADLILTGLRRRLGSARPASVNPDWYGAAGIAAVIGPIVMAAFAVVPLSAPFLGTGAGQHFAAVTFSGSIVAALWLAVAVVGMLRWRRLALAGSCALSAALIYDLTRVASDPYSFVAAFSWKVVFATLIVGSALLALKSKQRLLSWWAATATAIIAMLLAVLPRIEKVHVTPNTMLALALPAGLALVLLVVVKRQEAGVRSRLIVILATGAVTFAFDLMAFSGILGLEDPGNFTPEGRDWFQSPAVMVAVPVLCFAILVTRLARRERRLRQEIPPGDVSPSRTRRPHPGAMSTKRL